MLKEIGFSLRVNQKKRAVSSVGPVVRDGQFIYINEKRQELLKRSAMVISVNTKKKELIGLLKIQDEPGSDKQLRSMTMIFALRQKGWPYHTASTIWLPTTGQYMSEFPLDTACFATDCLKKWYSEIGIKRYPDALEMLVLADGGGSSRAGSCGWKYGLQAKLCNAFGLRVTVCHYPPGTTK
jgi:hypothetical protein